MNVVLTNEQEQNIRELLGAHSQRKHLLTLCEKYNFKNRFGKLNIIDELIAKIKNGAIPYNEFKKWLALHQIDGNNCFYVYELDEHNFVELSPYLESKSHEFTSDITLMNKDNIHCTQLVDINIDRIENLLIFSFISPAKVLKKELIADDTRQDVLVTQLYYANVIVNLSSSQIIVSINPTANLMEVCGVYKERKTYFEPIAEHFLNELREIASFTTRDPRWVYSALFHFAEEGTYHNNPHIAKELQERSEEIDLFVKDILTKTNMDDPASIFYLQEETKQAFENLLIDKYGVNAQDNSYKIFEQKGDQVDAYVHVGSRTSYLDEGNAAKVAKATRSYSDVTVLGVEKMVDSTAFRFVISKGKNYYLIKSHGTKFAEVRMVYELIGKINSYKEKILTDE